MLRGIFMSPKATKDQVEFYVELFKKVRATPEWQEFMKNGAFNTTFMTGADYAKWVESEEKRHEVLMKEAGFLARATEQSTGTQHSGGFEPAGSIPRGISWLPTDETAGPAHIAVEAGVALLIALFGAIVIIGSLKAGINWGAEGPRAGFFRSTSGSSSVAASASISGTPCANANDATVRRVGTASPGNERRRADRDLCRRDALPRSVRRLDHLHRAGSCDGSANIAG